LKKINVILPVYNEAEGIAAFDEALFQVLDTLRDRYTFEVIYVLDKSGDGTLEVLRGIAERRPQVRVLALSRRFGHQMSLVAGMDACDGDAAIMMDCDMEHPPSLIPALLEKFEQGYPIVQTRRRYNQAVSPLKRWASASFYRLINRLSSVRIEADAADFRLLSRRALHVFQTGIREQHQFLRGLFPWTGFETAEVTFESGLRTSGQSKYDLRRMAAFALDGIVSFSTLPLTLSVYIGLLVSGLALLYGLVVIVQFFLTRQLPSGWPTLAALVSFLGGLQLMVLGIIGRYLGTVVEEVKGRPLYIVEEDISPLQSRGITTRRVQDQP